MKVVPIIPLPLEPRVLRPIEVKAKENTENQQDLIDCIDDCQIILACGPAGTGKTHIALGKGLQGLRENKFKQLVLIRPLEECGKKVGFLPGELADKTAPYMKAFTELYKKFTTEEEILELIKDKRLVIETLEFLRGRTFDESFIVVDEAQNCEYKQLKMVLTRIGRRSKMILCGDLNQVDLDPKYWHNFQVPYAYVLDQLEALDVPNIVVVELTEADIVRHGIIKLICKALP